MTNLVIIFQFKTFNLQRSIKTAYSKELIYFPHSSGNPLSALTISCWSGNPCSWRFSLEISKRCHTLITRVSEHVSSPSPMLVAIPVVLLMFSPIPNIEKRFTSANNRRGLELLRGMIALHYLQCRLSPNGKLVSVYNR